MSTIRSGEPLWLAGYWLLFFLISLGLGYPALNRIDVNTVTGCSDAIQYFKVVTDTPITTEGRELRSRVLVPWVARPFYHLSLGRIGSWNPLAFGLLVSGSLFTATGAFLLLLIGRKYTASQYTAFTGVLLYLLNWEVSNKQIGCSLVDSGEAALMIALFWVLFERRFYLLPIVGLLGGLAKETFVPLCALATLSWALFEYTHGRWSLNHTLWTLSMVLISLGTIVVLKIGVYGHIIWPWQFAAQLRADYSSEGNVSLLRGLIGCLKHREFWYVFGWVLPLGAVRLKRFPSAWIWASLGGAAAGLGMGAWINAGGTTAPAVFHSIGPILSLSAAHLLGPAGGNNIAKTNGIPPPLPIDG